MTNAPRLRDFRHLIGTATLVGLAFGIGRVVFVLTVG